jgi:hypothetical protein
MGAQRLIIFFISVNSSLCGIHFCDTSRYKHKTDGQILSLDSCPSSSEYDIAKTIDFNDVINEFASVKAKKNYVVNLQLYMKNVNELHFVLCLYTVNKLKSCVRGKNCVSLGA